MRGGEAWGLAGAAPPESRPHAEAAMRDPALSRLPDDAGTLAILRALVRNPLEAIPEGAYRAGCVATRLFGRDLVYVAHPDLVRHVLTDPGTFGQSEVMRRSLAPLLGDGVLTADGPRWRHQRRAAAPAFRNEAALRLLPLMTAAAEAACDRWAARPGQTVNITAEMMRATLDVILGALLPGAEAIDRAHFGDTLFAYLEQSRWHLALSLLLAPHWLPYPGRRVGVRAAQGLRGMVLDILRSNAGGSNAGGSNAGGSNAGGSNAADADAGLLGLLRSHVDPESGRALTETELLDNLLTFVAAGHETTAGTLAWALFLLARHPAIEAQVLDEIAAVAPAGVLDADSLAALAATRRVVQETMRLYPAAPLLLRTARKATTLGGVALGPGASVYLPIYALHRHESAWPRPEVFDPDRFLPAQAQAQHRYAYLPFGAGPRACMGATLAMTEAVALLAAMLRRTRFSVSPGHCPRPIVRVTLRAQGDIPMQVEPRQRPLTEQAPHR